MTKIDPTANWVPPLTIKVASFSLLAGLLAFPFSIAGSNFFFALAIISSIFDRKIISYGFHVSWVRYHQITIGITLFIAFNFIGSLWGPFDDLAIHKMGKQLNWLIIPTIIGLIHFNPKLRTKAFIFISIGLFLHLILTTLQYLGIVTINGLGSNQHDAAGFFGHLSFGFIYGIWAGALLVLAQNLPSKWKYFCYIVAAYAVMTTFLAQGRSGYITTFACISLVIFKVWYPKRIKLKLFILSILILILSIFITTYAPTKSKLQQTIDGISSFLDGDWEHVDERIRIWAISIEVWKNNPFFGAGTAGYPSAVEKLSENPKYFYLLPPGSTDANTPYFGHSHNEFLFELSRWGPLGLLALLYLCFHWLQAGWKHDWDKDPMTAYLFTASALSVILHGLTEPSLNTQYSTVFAILVLGLAMSNKEILPKN